MLLNCQKVRNHLSRVIFVCQSIPYRNSCIFGKLFYNLLPETAILDSFVHSAKNSRGICDAFFFPYLGTRRVEISSSHTKVMGRYFKGTSGAGACLFKNQSDVFAAKLIYRLAFLFFLFQICGEINQILNFFRRIIF